jgi:hypothetical protein
MGGGAALPLIATGAVLTWAVDVDIPGVNQVTLGVILMVVGVLGLASSLIVWLRYVGKHSHDDGDLLKRLKPWWTP